MPAHIPYYDNQNKAIVDQQNHMLNRYDLNRIILKKGERYVHSLEEYESCRTVARRQSYHYKQHRNLYISRSRSTVWWEPDSVYIPLGDSAPLKVKMMSLRVLIAGGGATKKYTSFRVSPEEVDTIQ